MCVCARNIDIIRFEIETFVSGWISPCHIYIPFVLNIRTMTSITRCTHTRTHRHFSSDNHNTHILFIHLLSARPQPHIFDDKQVLEMYAKCVCLNGIVVCKCACAHTWCVYLLCACASSTNHSRSGPIKWYWVMRSGLTWKEIVIAAAAAIGEVYVTEWVCAWVRIEMIYKWYAKWLCENRNIVMVIDVSDKRNLNTIINFWLYPCRIYCVLTTFSFSATLFFLTASVRWVFCVSLEIFGQEIDIIVALNFVTVSRQVSFPSIFFFFFFLQSFLMKKT